MGMIRMAKDTIVFDVRGMRPRTFGDENYEGPWRNHIAEYVRRERVEGRIPVAYPAETLQTSCTDISVIHRFARQAAT